MLELSLKKKKICQFVIGVTFMGISSGKGKEKWLIWRPYQKTKDEFDDKPREAYLRISITTPSQV